MAHRGYRWTYTNPEAISAYLEARQLSLREFATRLGLTYSAVYAWFKRGTVPGRTTQARVAALIASPQEETQGHTAAEGTPPAKGNRTPEKETSALTIAADVAVKAMEAYPGRIQAEEVPVMLRNLIRALEGRR